MSASVLYNLNDWIEVISSGFLSLHQDALIKCFISNVYFRVNLGLKFVLGIIFEDKYLQYLQLLGKRRKRPP